MKFTGFPRGARYTPVPDILFGPLLEAIEDPAELKCTLRALWLLHRKKGYPRSINSAELLADRVLLVGLKGLESYPPDPPDPKEAIRRGIRLAVERGTFLRRSVESDEHREEVYFLNDEAGRRAATVMGEGTQSQGLGVHQEGVVDLPSERPSIFALYEENIGLLTPLLAEQMLEAEAAYPGTWIEEAFKIAVGRNKRSWRYIETTLGRWAAEGKGDGESRRYPQKAAGAEDAVEYLRRRGRLPGS